MSLVETVYQGEMDKVRGELCIMKNEKAVLESKLVGYDDIVEEVSPLKATVASLELEKIGLMDKIAMSNHTICVNFGRKDGSEMMNAEYNMGMHETDLPLYDPTRVQKMEELNTLVGRAGGSTTSTSGHGGSGEPRIVWCAG
ncbi:unnamed protein product [Lactuca saligna]|uniref:Uncharacterized protein n=1 Tax=Lactuca saligna TaxID=75948 RepID=A0AA36EJ07_LACSI|nr:unnamed protein product [Lactuca saligna]